MLEILPRGVVFPAAAMGPAKTLCKGLFTSGFGVSELLRRPVAAVAFADDLLRGVPGESTLKLFIISLLIILVHRVEIKLYRPRNQSTF